MSSPPAEWIPRGDDRGDVLRRAFEERLERREAHAPAAALERLRLADLEWRRALVAIGDLPEDVRRVMAGVLELPLDAQAALAELL